MNRLTPAGRAAVLRLAFEAPSIAIPEATAYYLMRLRLVRRTGSRHRTVMLADRGRRMIRRLARNTPTYCAAIIGHRQHA